MPPLFSMHVLRGLTLGNKSKVNYFWGLGGSVRAFLSLPCKFPAPDQLNPLQLLSMRDVTHTFSKQTSLLRLRGRNDISFYSTPFPIEKDQTDQFGTSLSICGTFQPLSTPATSPSCAARSRASSCSSSRASSSGRPSSPTTDSCCPSSTSSRAKMVSTEFTVFLCLLKCVKKLLWTLDHKRLNTMGLREGVLDFLLSQ